MVHEIRPCSAGRIRKNTHGCCITKEHRHPLGHFRLNHRGVFFFGIFFAKVLCAAGFFSRPWVTATWSNGYHCFYPEALFGASRETETSPQGSRITRGRFSSFNARRIDRCLKWPTPTFEEIWSSYFWILSGTLLIEIHSLRVKRPDWRPHPVEKSFFSNFLVEFLVDFLVLHTSFATGYSFDWC